MRPPEQCDHVQPLKPSECRRCGEKLSGCDPEPLRHQVWELPEIKPHVREYQRHRLCCPTCGETTCAELPAGVPQGQSGPRLMAITALLMAYYRQSKRRTAEFLSTLLGQPCSAALAVKMQTHVTAAVRPASEELAAQLPTQDQVNADETPTKEANGKAWLWTFVRCEGVEPTNNAGGSRFVETMLTVIETCRQQRRNAFEYLTAAVHSHLAHQPAPSLVPGV